MERPDFATIISWPERRSIMTWLAYTFVSTALLIGYGMYEQLFVWQSTNVQEPIAMLKEQDLQVRLEQKAAVSKEVIALRERSAHLERIRQQRANPHQLIQELLSVVPQGIQIQTVTADAHTVHLMARVSQAQQVDALLAVCAEKPVLQVLHLSSWDAVDGAIQITLQAQI